MPSMAASARVECAALTRLNVRRAVWDTARQQRRHCDPGQLPRRPTTLSGLTKAACQHGALAYDAGSETVVGDHR